jgi:hypothetical protein
MNTDRIRHLADVIEAQPHTTLAAESGFNMNNWTHTCGTPACICGWTNYVRTGDDEGFLGDVSAAAHYLGISGRQAEELFSPEETGEDGDNFLSWSDITPAHAAAVLRHLAETGRVDWSVVPRS